MRDVFYEALNHPGLLHLLITILLAGLVRGFAGFGTAMIIMPLGAMVVSPLWALNVMIVVDTIAPLFLLKRAYRDGEPSIVGQMIIGMVVGLPIGLYLLSTLDPEQFRLIAGIVILLLLAIMISGWRYTRPLGRNATIGVGAGAGFMGGFLALPGPLVILAQMASARGAAAVRGNLILYLFAADVGIIVVLGLMGDLSAVPLMIGALLTIPFTVASLIGQWIFNPAYEQLYRVTAYIIIAGSALIALPFWGF